MNKVLETRGRYLMIKISEGPKQLERFSLQDEYKINNEKYFTWDKWYFKWDNFAKFIVCFEWYNCVMVQWFNGEMSK